MKIGNFDLDKDGVYIIAELSANHNGSLNLALESIKSAKDAGANAIKLQTYTPDTLTINCKKEDFLIKGTLWDKKSLYELYESAYTPWQWHKELFEYAKSIGIDIFSSPFDKSAVDFLQELEPIAYKIASFEICDYELIRYTASKQKPMIISTGIATIEEIQDVINICKSQNNPNISLLKCTSSYPAPLDEANLLTITDLANTFNVISGLSDHTLGITAPIVAVSLGAKIIEKHFILDKTISSADSKFSLDKNEFKSMVNAIRDTQKLLGKIDYSMSDKKVASREQFGRSLYVVKSIKKGEVFSNENIKSIRPGYGMHPKHLKDILGQTATRDYEFGEAFHN